MDSPQDALQVSTGVETQAAIGLTAFPAGFIGGLLWQGIGPWEGFGPAAPLCFGAALALIAALLLILWLSTLSRGH